MHDRHGVNPEERPAHVLHQAQLSLPGGPRNTKAVPSKTAAYGNLNERHGHGRSLRARRPNERGNEGAHGDEFAG